MIFSQDYTTATHLKFQRALIILFVALVLKIVTLGAYPLMDMTEARYAEIAREMVTSNHWIMPQIDPGVPFWGKPPLSIWATALSFKLFGISEFTARLSSLIFVVGSIFLIFILAKYIENRLFALKTAVVMSTMGLVYYMASGVMTDPALLFTVTLSMVDLIIKVDRSNV